MGRMTNRSEARDLVSRPGKFQGCHPMVPIIWDVVQNGMADEDAGPAARVGRWIVVQDNNGFVYGRRYPSDGEASYGMRPYWREIEDAALDSEADFE